MKGNISIDESATFPNLHFVFPILQLNHPC